MVVVLQESKPLMGHPMRPEHYLQLSPVIRRRLRPATKAVLIDMASAWLNLADQAHSIGHQNYGRPLPVKTANRQVPLLPSEARLCCRFEAPSPDH